MNKITVQDAKLNSRYDNTISLSKRRIFYHAVNSFLTNARSRNNKIVHLKRGYIFLHQNRTHDKLGDRGGRSGSFEIRSYAIRRTLTAGRTRLLIARV